MQIDYSAAEQFLSYVDDDEPLTEVWEHPAYGIARKHAELLGRSLSKADVTGAMVDEGTSFSGVENLRANRERIEQLVQHIQANETDWTERMERHLERVVPDEDASDLTVFLAIGYELGIGLQGSAYVNLNEPLFLENPRQLLYAALHESSHVLYDRVHGFSDSLDSQNLTSQEGQREFFDVLFHTEAYATYTPLELRKSDGNAESVEHPLNEDYRVVDDEKRLRSHVEEYDSFRRALERGSGVSRETLMTRTFGTSRLPYRVGCAVLAGIEEKRGLEAVRDAFYTEPGAFVEEYDWILDDYRNSP